MSSLDLPQGYFYRSDLGCCLFLKYSCVQASLAPLLQDIYGERILEVDFFYLAFGSATAIASYGVGMITNYD